jgi:hypothetical protein
MPDWIQTEDDWNEFVAKHREMGIEIQRDQMVKNSAKKIGAKLLCNSLWGKFGENTTYMKFESYDTRSDLTRIIATENKWLDGNIEVTYRRTTNDGLKIAMVYQDNSQKTMDSIYEKKRRMTRNIAIASFVTSHARCRLWAEMNKLGERVLYHDTDSIIYEYNPLLYNIPFGKYLGEWESELKGKMVRFVSTGPKCYSYVDQKPNGDLKKVTKTKGITLTSYNVNLIHFDSMKDLVTGQKDKFLAKSLLFKYSQRFGTLLTMMVDKIFKKTYTKGFIGPDYKVKPFGWDRFS